MARRKQNRHIIPHGYAGLYATPLTVEGRTYMSIEVTDETGRLNRILLSANQAEKLAQQMLDRIDVVRKLDQ